MSHINHTHSLPPTKSTFPGSPHPSSQDQEVSGTGLFFLWIRLRKTLWSSTSVLHIHHVREEFGKTFIVSSLMHLLVAIRTRPRQTDPNCIHGCPNDTIGSVGDEVISEYQTYLHCWYLCCWRPTEPNRGSNHGRTKSSTRLWKNVETNMGVQVERSISHFHWPLLHN